MKPIRAGRLLGSLALLGVLALNGCTWRPAAQGITSPDTPTPFQPEPVDETPTLTAVLPTITSTQRVIASAAPRQITPAIPLQATAIDGSSYTVQPNDTLPAIALRFQLEPLDLMRANHIANASSIYAGQVLVIPGVGVKRILVDLSDQRLYAYQGERLVFQFVVSTGASDGTRTGSFRILDKLPKVYSDMWGFWMHDWMGIYYAGPDFENGFHALPLLPNGEQIWGDSLGTPITFGCVVLAPQDAQRLYDWVELGTPVEIRE